VLLQTKLIKNDKLRSLLDLKKYWKYKIFSNMGGIINVNQRINT
jgi:hypothetical protein